MNLDGSSQRYTDESARKKLRETLLAVGKVEANEWYVRKDRKLEDLILLTAEENNLPYDAKEKIKNAQKERICTNIGAAYALSYQPKIYDSGWKTILDGNVGFRQIGMVVYIEGGVNPSRFYYTKIPEGIGRPKFPVSQHFGQFQGYDYARGAKIIVENDYIHCEHQSDDAWVRLSLTYIVE